MREFPSPSAPSGAAREEGEITSRIQPDVGPRRRVLRARLPGLDRGSQDELLMRLSGLTARAALSNQGHDSVASTSLNVCDGRITALTRAGSGLK